MFIAALFTIAKTWKQPKCPSTEAWIKKMWYIYTMENYSAIKRNKIPVFLATWMDLEIIMLSEVSHTVRHQHQMLSLTCGIWRKDRMNFLQNRCWDIEILMVSGGDSLRGGEYTGFLGWKFYKTGSWWSLYNYKCNKFIE